MRTLPAKFSTDFGSGKDLFFLFVIKGDGGNLYWHTSDKSFSLWPGTAAVHGGSALTKDATRIAFAADGESVPVSQIQGEVSIEFGGGIGSVSSMTLTLLNQDRYDQTFDGDDIINRVVDVRMGFVDTTNGVGVNDMLLLKSFVVDSAEDYDYRLYTLTLVDGSFQRHRDIPNILIDKDGFPNAPDGSSGQRIPVLYGDFETYNTTALYNEGGTDLYPYHFGMYDVAPSVCTNILAKFVAVSEIGPLVSTDAMFHIPDEGVVGRVSTGFTVPSTVSGSGYVRPMYGETVYADYYLIPRTLGDQYVNATASIIDGEEWAKAVDDDPDTYARATGELPDSYPVLSGKLSTESINGILVSLDGNTKFRALVTWGGANASPTNTAQFYVRLWYHFNPSGIQFTTFENESILGGGADIAKHITVGNEPHGEGHTLQDFSMEVGVWTNSVDATVDIYHVCVLCRVRLKD